MASAGPHLSDRQRVALEALGIDVWTRRIPIQVVAGPNVAVPNPPGPGVASPAVSDSVVTLPAVTGTTGDAPDDWRTLEHEALSCTKCQLHRTRTKVVFGVGDRQSRWLVIGEAPGADEDRQGEPFVGRAGQLLNEMLKAVGLAREQVYIANILKCRPPENRDPKPEESASCEGYLQRQIALVQPGLLLAVGRIAAQNLLHDDTPIGKLRGRVHRYGPTGIPLVVTYHPAYLLRSPGNKRKAWEDLCLARTTVEPLRDRAPANPAADER